MNQALLQFQPSDALSSEVTLGNFNLCVQDGLEPTKEIVDKIQDGVKYVAASEGRRIKFSEICMSLGLKCKKLILDVSTRWNSTFNMLSCAIEFKDAFLIYSTSDLGFKEYVPSPGDWERVEGVCSFLEEDKDASMIRNESSEMSSSDANFFNEHREIPKGINDYESFIRESGGIIEPTKSELEEYLTASIIPPNSKFDVLAWWKANASKFPILSKMAFDVLSIPISTVASESTFSVGSRVIEPHHSCLRPETVEVLLCGADWNIHIVWCIVGDQDSFSSNQRLTCDHAYKLMWNC
ncbi:hypothetical protein POM88_002883 [Heracleum sosnowskyi]|uniref:HAT C-terminal dimerisation domain-containing protein n=1 Tax=Heracleum sosnowskyi TaxID=360622 RepID=A0AAD8ND02_9APIA|nr:hypothetical protein POM88_002883 [Heracleum sosnowskyi]